MAFEIAVQALNLFNLSLWSNLVLSYSRGKLPTSTQRASKLSSSDLRTSLHPSAIVFSCAALDRNGFALSADKIHRHGTRRRHKNEKQRMRWRARTSERGFDWLLYCAVCVTLKEAARTWKGKGMCVRACDACERASVL